MRPFSTRRDAVRAFVLACAAGCGSPNLTTPRADVTLAPADVPPDVGFDAGSCSPFDAAQVDATDAGSCAPRLQSRSLPAGWSRFAAQPIHRSVGGLQFGPTGTLYAMRRTQPSLVNNEQAASYTIGSALNGHDFALDPPQYVDSVAIDAARGWVYALETWSAGLRVSRRRPGTCFEDVLTLPIQNGGANFVDVAPNGEVLLAVHPADGSRDMLYLGRCLGMDWSQRGTLPDDNVSASGWAPSDPSRIYLGTSIGLILTSRDAGLTFARVDLPTDTRFYPNPIWSIAVDPVDADRVFVGSLHGMFESRDGGQTFTRVEVWTAPADVGRDDRVVVHVARDRSVWAMGLSVNDGRPSAGAGLFSRALGSSTWVRRDGALPDHDRPGGGFAMLERDGAPARIVRLTATDRLYESTDGGEHWGGEFTGLTTLALSRDLTDPRDPRVLYAVDDGEIWKSTDAGNRFDRLFPNGIFTRAVVLGDGTLLAAASFYGPSPMADGIMRSMDGGTTHVVRVSGVSTERVRALLADRAPSTAYGVWGEENSDAAAALWVTNDSGANWTRVREVDEVTMEAGVRRVVYEGTVLVDPTTAGRVYLVRVGSDVQVLVSEDQGRTVRRVPFAWTPAALGPRREVDARGRLILEVLGAIPDGVALAVLEPTAGAVVLRPLPPGEREASAVGSVLLTDGFHSRDGGQTWVANTADASQLARMAPFAHRADPQHWYANWIGAVHGPGI